MRIVKNCKILIVMLISTFLCGSAAAQLIPEVEVTEISPAAKSHPYFRFLGKGNWNVGEGASFSAKGLAQTQNVTMLAIITHSTADGSILPQAWVDAGWADAWTPLSVGFGFGGGSTDARLGCSANVSPTARNLAIKGLGFLHSPTAKGLKELFESMPDNLTFAFGPGLGAQIIHNGVIQPLNKWWGDPVRYDFMAAWHFGGK